MSRDIEGLMRILDRHFDSDRYDAVILDTEWITLEPITEQLAEVALDRARALVMVGRLDEAIAISESAAKAVQRARSRAAWLEQSLLIALTRWYSKKGSWGMVLDYSSRLLRDDAPEYRSVAQFLHAYALYRTGEVRLALDAFRKCDVEQYWVDGSLQETVVLRRICERALLHIEGDED
ncbi:MAG TPA: hypothetical protein RMH85_16235 [Polyangiaceae bacterium LLY-WYZ-15_(1-7)]|nr:hypothetical protein [Polyangiaceae bacterium LLY-WYZ-15_(1-7)]HJL01200.1 hypothetical protein [Polyangiaceae bacterium LLY-WYZ-15_(1-7)]HJL10051.1 hypothetical protein [Polyangiaceae bacterium LLY-WYZ-15_(1-7)]HJL32124.1 hypothetical protein [Polyangiaceae bacterium LLY-WYZ-15_(1-7)]HJL36676.1 hypothetical protein [Polyangiaceae bacterium LLY-WYZ-15_(1-7)]